MSLHNTPTLSRQIDALLTTFINDGFDFRLGQDATGQLWRDLADGAQNGASDALLMSLAQKYNDIQVAPGIEPGTYLAMFAFCSHTTGRLKAASTYVALSRAWAAKGYWSTPQQEQKALDDLLLLANAMPALQAAA